MRSSRTVRRITEPLLEQSAAYDPNVERFAAVRTCTQRFRS